MKTLKVPLPDGMTDTEALSLLIAAARKHRRSLEYSVNQRTCPPVGNERENAVAELKRLGPLTFSLEIEGIRHGIL